MISRRLIAVLASLICPLAASAATIRVPESAPTIQSAIDRAQPGDVLELSGGRYAGPVLITKPVTLRATDQADVVFTAGPEPAAVMIVAEGITVHLDGLSIQGGTVGLQLNSRARAAVRRCAITGQSQAGIAAQENVELALWDNTIVSVTGAALQVAATAKVIGGGNRFHNNGADVAGWVPYGVQAGKEPSVMLRTDPDMGFSVALALTPSEGPALPPMQTVNLPTKVDPGTYGVSVQARGATSEIPWGSVRVDGETVVRVDSGIRLDRLLPVPWRVLDAKTGGLITTVSRARAVPLPPGRYRLMAQDVPIGPPDGVVVSVGRQVQVPVGPVEQPTGPMPIAIDDPEVAALLVKAGEAQPTCSSPVAASGRLLLGGDPLAVSPEGAAAVWLWRFDEQGRPVRRTAAVQPDGVFRIERVAPGVYFMASQYRNAEGRYFQGTSQTINVGCDGAAGLSQRVEDTDVRLPDAPEEPHARRLPTLPALMPEACAEESDGFVLRTGGCAEDPNQPPCACGKLRVCVFSGDNRLFASGGNVPGPINSDEIGRWKWLGRDMPSNIPSTFEQEFANALDQAGPCYDIVPMDSTWDKLLERGREFARLFDALKAARAAGDTARAQQLEAEAQQLLQTNLVQGLETLGHATCPAVVVLGSNGVIPKITASVQVEGETEPSGSATATGSWARRLADQVNQALTPAQQALGCPCQAVQSHCTTVHFDVAGATSRCEFVQSCCGKEMNRWSDQQGGTLAKGGTKFIPGCCNKPAQDAGDSEGKCPETGGLLSRDLDCDGLANADDPTPLPAEEVETLDRKLDEETAP